METTVKELPDSRVRVDVDVDPEGRRGQHQPAPPQQLGQDMKLPGFRKGKVPPEMVVQRLGRETVLTQALESSLGDWYERAMLDSGVNPVGDPKLDLSDLPDEGKPLKFSIEVAVRPGAELGEYKGLEVGREEPEVPEEAVEAELNAPARGLRPPQPGRPGGEGGRRRPDRLRGQDRRRAVRGRHRQGLSARAGGGPGAARAGEGARSARRPATSARRRCRSPTTIPAEEVAGKTAEFDVNVKEVREKELPELNDDFAAEASEFDTLAELREHISGQIREILERPDRRALPRGRPRRGGRQREGRAARPGGRGAGRRDVAPGRAPAAAAGDGPRELPADPGQDARGDDRGRPGPTPSRR